MTFDQLTPMPDELARLGVGNRRVNDAQVDVLGTLTREANERIAERADAALTELTATTSDAGTRAHVLAREMQQHVEVLDTLARNIDPYTRRERDYSRVGDVVAMLVRDDRDARARLGRANAARVLQRAVANQTTADNAGVLPTVMPEQVGYGTVGLSTTPLLALLAVPLAKFGASIDIPTWDAWPTADIMTGQKIEAPSNAAHLDAVTMNAATAALTYNVSLQLLDAQPSYGDELELAMRSAVDAALEGYVCSTLLAGATDHAATLADLLDTLGTVWAAVGAAWPAGEPDVIVADPGSAFTIRRALGTANMAGAMPAVIASSAVPDGRALIFPRGAVAVYASDPVTEAQLEPGILGQAVAVYRYGACGVRIPAAVHSLTVT
jgi:hypothetical protein